MLNWRRCTFEVFFGCWTLWSLVKADFDCFRHLIFLSLEDAQAIILQQWEDMDDAARASWSTGTSLPSELDLPSFNVDHVEAAASAPTPSRRRDRQGVSPRPKRLKVEVDTSEKWFRPGQGVTIDDESEEEQDDDTDEEDRPRIESVCMCLLSYRWGYEWRELEVHVACCFGWVLDSQSSKNLVGISYC